jgi:hypothetical protein
MIGGAGIRVGGTGNRTVRADRRIYGTCLMISATGSRTGS